jgi:hypothetical protein
MLRSIRFLALLGILLLPMAVALLYWTHSNYIPQDDGSVFLIDGFRVYQHFRHDGFRDGMHALYFLRGWRPTVFDRLLVPALALAGGRIYPASCLVAFFVTSYATLYAFLLLREWLSSLSAAIGAAFVTSLPLWLCLSVYFYSETALPGLIIGAMYHLLKSRDFSNLKHVGLAALLSALAFCVRHDTTLLMLLPVLLTAIGMAWRNRILTARDLLPCALIALLAVGIFFLRVLWMAGAGSSFPRTGGAGAAFFLNIVGRFLILTMTLLVLSIPVVFAVARKTGSAAHALLGFTIVLCVLPLVWFFPFALPLFEWMYQATIGDGAQNMMPSSIPLWTSLWGLLSDSGSFLMISAVALAAWGMLTRASVTRGAAARGAGRRAPSYLLLSAVAPLALLLLGASLSPAFGVGAQLWRRLFAPFCTSMLALVLIGLRPGRQLAWRQGMALVVLLTQTLAVGMRSAGVEGALADARAFSGVLDKPRLAVPEPNHEVIAALNRLAETEPVSLVDIEGYTDVSVGGVRLLAAVMETPYVVDNDYLPRYGGQYELPSLAQRYSHVVFSVTPPTHGVPDEVQRRIREYRSYPDANSHRQADMMQLVLTDGLPPYGLEWVRTMVLGQGEVFFLRSLVYGRNRAATPTPGGLAEAGVTNMAGADNLASVRRGARAIASDSQTGYSVANLNDGTPAPWGSAEGQTDVYAGVVLPAARAATEFRITVFSPSLQQHVRDLSVVAADSDGPNGPAWRIVRSRLSGAGVFSKMISVPVVTDGTIVRIEIDPTDANWKPHTIWGLACFSGSLGYSRNYIAGTGVYVRELEIK